MRPSKGIAVLFMGFLGCLLMLTSWQIAQPGECDYTDESTVVGDVAFIVGNSFKVCELILGLRWWMVKKMVHEF